MLHLSLLYSSLLMNKGLRLPQLNSGICSCDDIISSYWIKTCLKKEKRHTSRHQYGAWIGINCKHDRVAEVTQFRSKLTTKPKKNFSTKADAIFPWLHVSCAILRARPAMWAFLHEEAVLLYTRKKDVYGKAGNIRAEIFSQSVGWQKNQFNTSSSWNERFAVIQQYKLNNFRFISF